MGLAGVDRNLVESARGMGMGPIRTLLRVELPLAWPVVLTGVRVSTQMSWASPRSPPTCWGPAWAPTSSTGWPGSEEPDAVESALVGTLGVVLLALVLDGLLVLLRRATTSAGIRV